jgi:hypothetical protein
MLWKRSKIVDFEYKFPAATATIMLEEGTVKIEAGYASTSLKEAFDPEYALDFEDAVIGQEVIYTEDKEGVMESFYTVEEWEGPSISLGGSTEWTPPNPVDTLLERISEINPEALYPSDMKDAVIGMVERFGMQPVVLLDREKCIEILMQDGMDRDDAEEFFSVNTIGSWMGEGTPCFATVDRNLL